MIKVQSLSKKFKIYENPWHRLLEWATGGGACYHKDFWALRDVTFDVQQGECLGIIGPNGAGKSTLLKILTRTLYPSAGTFDISGRVLSLLELGTGFNQELTGRQNLYNSVHLLGLPTEYLEERLEDIRNFAELDEFFDRPVKIYSSGMYIRLAFSLFVFLKPEVLIVDETLSVGDIFFQQKSFAKMREIISSGTTCLFVSHDMSAIQNLCERAVLLEKGEVTFIGAATETVSRYYGTFGSSRRRRILDGTTAESICDSDNTLIAPDDILLHNMLPQSASRHGVRGLEIAAVRITDKTGRDTLQVEMLDCLTFHLLIQAHDEIMAPSAGIHLFDRLGNVVFASGTRQLRKTLPDLHAGDRIVVKMKITFNVQPGEYTFSLGASEVLPEESPNVALIHDRHNLLGPIVVTADCNELMPFYGIAQLPMDVSFAKVAK